VKGELGPVVLGGVLAAAIRMMDAAGRWLARGNRRLEGGQRQPGIDAPADAVADDAAGPGIEDGSEVDEAAIDRDVGDIGNLRQLAGGRGLGETATFLGRFRDFGRRGDLVGVQCRGRVIFAWAGVIFDRTGPAQTLIAAISGPMPRMFVTRVRL